MIFASTGRITSSRNARTSVRSWVSSKGSANSTCFSLNLWGSVEARTIDRQRRHQGRLHVVGDLNEPRRVERGAANLARKPPLEIAQERATIAVGHVDAGIGIERMKARE